MTKELRKAIMNSSRLKKKYQGWPSRKTLKTGGNKKKTNSVEKLKRTILRTSQKAI